MSGARERTKLETRNSKLENAPEFRISSLASRRLLLAGCGNPYAGDDSVGLEIIRRLQASGADGPACVELAGGGLKLLELFAKAEVILLVDAVQSGAPAGTLHLLPLPSNDVVARGLNKVSSHGWNLDATLRLARALGRRVPRLMLLGVELATVTLGAPRTAAVDAALESIVAHFPELKAAILDPQSALWEGHHTYEPPAPMISALHKW